ncbi:MAG: DNA polymerase [Vulcanibacillus sp.]
MDLLDMMESGIPSTVNVKRNKQTIYNTPIQYSTDENNKNVQYTFIVDKWLTKNELEYFKRFLVKHNFMDFQILCSTNIEVDLEKAPAKQFTINTWNFENYIKPWTKIITFGRAMFSVCKTTDLNCAVKSSEESGDKNLDKNSIIEGFYDTLLEESNFFDPVTKCIVFPVDGWVDLIKKDTQLFANRFETKFLNVQLKRAFKYELKPQKIKQIKYSIISNPNEWMLEQIESREKNSILAWDLETGGQVEDGGLDPFSDNGMVRCFTCAFYDDPYTGYYAEWKDIDVTVLEKFLFHFTHLGSNLSFDYKWLIVKQKLNINIITKLVYDTIHISQIYNTNQRNSLKSNAWVYTMYGGYDKPLEEYKNKNPVCKKNYAKIPQDVLVTYASQDPCMSILVHQRQEQLINEIDRKYPITFIKDSKWSMWKFYTELRIPTQRVFTRAEINGSEVNWDKIKYTSKYLEKKIAKYEKQIRDLLNITDENFNISSNDQLGQHIESLGVKCYGRGKKNYYLVNALTLSKWEEDGYPWAKVIDEYHSIKTLYGTFVGNEEQKTGYFQYRKYDDKVHSTFGVGLNSTGRNNSKNPNLQNIPKHGFLALEAKDFFTPENINECAICELDGASLQLRIEASLSRDKRMTALFQNGVDMHTVTAHFLFGGNETFEEFDAAVKAGDKKHKSWRQAAKGPNFSLAFNTTANAFAKSTLLESGAYKWSLEQTKEYIELNNLHNERLKTYKYLLEKPQHGIDDVEKYSYYLTCATDIREKWLDKYEGIKYYIEFKIEEGRTYGACFTPFGFIRRVPLLKWCDGEDDNKAKIKNAENIMSNINAQLMEWMMISKSMIAVDDLIKNKNYKSKILGNVHDSIVLQLYYDEAHDIIKTAQTIFCEDIKENNGVPYELSLDYGIWGNGEEFILEELKDFKSVKEKVTAKVNKIRKEMIFYN